MAHTKPLKLNLGCGPDYREGWVNVDNDRTVKTDLLHDLYNPLPFAQHSVEEITAQDILEHFTDQDGDRLVSEMARVMKKGGILTLRVPNVDDIITRFASDPETRNIFLYGDTTHTGIFGSHKVGYTKTHLIAKMKKCGFDVQAIEEKETNFEATFVYSGAPTRIRSVAFINQTLDIGGAEHFNTDLLAQLQREGIRIHAFVTHEPFSQMLQELSIETTAIHVVLDIIGNWKGLFKAVVLVPTGIFSYWNIVKELKKRQVDCILLTGFIEKILVTPMATLHHIPVVWVEFGPLSPIFGKFFRLPKILYRLVKDLPQAVIIPSNHTKSDLLTSARISLAKLSVIPCGRSLRMPNAKSQKPESPVLLCVSRLDSGKGQDLLIRAMPAILKKHPTVKLRITGRDGTHPILSQIVKDLRLGSSVEFVGWVPNVLEEMANATICVFPSVWALEGFGLVTIEAMACGKPIVAFDCGPTKEIIRHEQNGLLAMPGDVNDLARQIIRVLDDRALAKRLGEQAKKDFASRYQIEKIAGQYIEKFKEAVALSQAKYEN